MKQITVQHSCDPRTISISRNSRKIFQPVRRSLTYLLCVTLLALPASAQDASPPTQDVAPPTQDATSPPPTTELPPVTIENQDAVPDDVAAEEVAKPVVKEPPVKPKAKKKSVKTAKKKPKPAPTPAPSEPVEVLAEPDSVADLPAQQTTTSTTGQGRGGPSGVDGYQATRSSSATKTDTPLRDVPQSATVVTKELARDQGSLDLNDVLRYVPGVIVQQGEGHRDAITLRGQSTTADFYTDGVRDDIQYFRDIYNVDVVEVLKGPNAMIFGRGGGGGVVNRVTKKAEFETISEGAVTFGSFNTKRVTADAGSALTPDFAFRLNGMYENSGGFRDFYELERYGINPTFTARLTDQTTLRMSYEYFNDARTVDRGVPSVAATGRPSNPARSTFFGDPDQSFSEFDAHIATATLEHKFAPGLALRNHFSFGHYDKFYQNVFPAGPVANDGTFTIQGYDNATVRDSVFNQTDLTAKIDQGNGIRHTIVAGVEVGYQASRQARYEASFVGGLPPGTTTANRSTGPLTVANGNLLGVPFANPTLRGTILSFDTPQNGRLNNTDLTTVSAYVQDQLEITKMFQLIGGLRFERFDLDYENAFNGDRLGRVDEVWSPRIGAVFKPTESVSLYVSHARSFLPFSGEQFSVLTSATANLQPEEFVNNELGFKWDVLPRLAFAGALFQLDRENQLVTTGPGTGQQIGRTRTRGFELSLTGNVTDAWQVALGYGYQNARVAEGDSAGNRLPSAPEHVVSLWNRYDVTPSLGIGLGIIHATDFYPSLNNAVTVPGYTRLDAALYYKINDHLDAQLNIENVLDETYFSSAHNNDNISYGAPRSFFVTVTGRY